MQITMAKQNFFFKNFKRRFLTLNDTIENYFDKLRFFVINLKKIKKEEMEKFARLTRELIR